MCLGKIARRAAIYHDIICEAILKGLQKQLQRDRRARVGETGTNIVMTEANDYVNDAAPHLIGYCGSDAKSPTVTDEPGRAHLTDKITKDRREAKPEQFGLLSMKTVTDEYRDDLTGQPLPSDLVEKGKNKELDYFSSKKVWTTVP